VAKPKFQIYSDAAGRYRWRLKDADGEKEAKVAAQLVKDTAPDAEIDD
jgi:uncharacterized protein YegP (UPF0339 family)